MSKHPKIEPADADAQAKVNGGGPKQAVELLCNIGEQVLTFHGETKPTLSAISRLMGRASRLLQLKDLDERFAVENKATIELCQKLHLIS
jgi:hypothetical protein